MGDCRFHAVSEFDDSKRSCRRRLAGHNERRRKSSHDSVARNPSQGMAPVSLTSVLPRNYLITFIIIKIYIYTYMF